MDIGTYSRPKLQVFICPKDNGIILSVNSSAELNLSIGVTLTEKETDYLLKTINDLRNIPLEERDF